MAITRTIMVDDDGSGTTGTILNNAWLQTIYDQIDAIGTQVPWTPIDVSGAGLTFSSAVGYSVRSGRAVLFWVSVVFPATSNGASVQIGGLPVTAGLIHGGGYTTFGLGCSVHVPTAATSFYLVSPAGVTRTNAEMSGSNWIGAGQYLSA